MKSGRGWVLPAVVGVVLVAVLVGALLLYSRLENKMDSTADRTPAYHSSTDTTASAEATPAPAADAAIIGDSGIPGVFKTATQTAPDLTLTDVNGATVRLSSLRGLPTVINFWSTGCAPCREEMDGFQKMYDEYGTQVNFVMLNPVSQGDTVASAQKFCNDHGYTFPLYFDEDDDAITLFGVTGLPETVLLNAKGQSYGKVIGGMPQSMLAQAMQLLLAR